MTCPNHAGNTHHNFGVPVFREVEELIKCLSDFPHVGIAIVDSRFRYLRLNHALAAMNGVPADFHVGKTLRDVLGPAAQQLEPRLAQVFATGKSTRFEFEARLPKRNETGRWNVMYFPFKSDDFEGVCSVVRELTENSGLRVPLFGLTSKLQALRAIINRETVETPDCTRRALDLLNMCISEIIALSKVPNPAMHKITQDILSGQSTIFANHDSRLTNRELEVVRLLSGGKSNKEIAAALSISVKTVEHHRTNAMYKLNAHSLVDLLRFASRCELIKLG